MQKKITMQDYLILAFHQRHLQMHRVPAVDGKVYRIWLEREILYFQYQREQWNYNRIMSVPEEVLLEVDLKEGNGTVYLKKMEKQLCRTGKIRLDREKTVTVGSDYGNTIFYSFHALVQKKHLLCTYLDGKCRVHNLGGSGCYRNGKSFSGEEILQKGDRVELYGLCLQFLPPYLIVIPYAGASRVLEREAFPRGDSGQGRMKRQIRFYPETTEEIITEEVEVLLPKEVPKGNRTPIVLSLGPSVTMMLPILLMGYLHQCINPEKGSNFYYITMLTGVCSAVCNLIWGITNYLYEQHSEQTLQRGRTRQYQEYLTDLEKTFAKWQEHNRQILQDRYPMAETLFTENGAIYVCWNRYYSESDFLYIPIGTGTIPNHFPIRLSENGKKIIKDKFAKEAMELQQRYEKVENVPVGISFATLKSLRIELPQGELQAVLRQIFFQLLFGYPDSQLRMVCFYEEECLWQQRFAECMKWIPHCWSQDGKVRFLAGNAEEAAEILPTLTKEISNTAKQPYYMVFLLKEEWIRGEVLQNYLLGESLAYPVLTIGMKWEDNFLEGKWSSRIRAEGKERRLIVYGKEEIQTWELQLAGCSMEMLEKYTRGLADVPRSMAGNSLQLPETVGFLELFQCTDMEELQSPCRWQEARPEKRLKVPIGKSSGGHMVYLDVHEKFHGPHGLIAGTTGSGKSELLQTYLLSLAVSFSPQDINFFMIDYKGGGTGNAIQKLPHCAGVVSNLSGNQIRRAMLAISSENKRRQRIFSDVEVNHIDAYTILFREGKVSSPLPHLLIVIDEFAELKREEPDFMQEIISLAQVGRSLGVHLLLATQKPAGTVDEKIWSNARFRLCLKVQDRQDSMDMLHKPDASFLTRPGQCYLQIGNDEYYQLLQTAYCGGLYTPVQSEKEEVVLVTRTGREMKIKEDYGDKEKTKMIDIIINYVNKSAAECGCAHAMQLWTEELPAQYAYEEIPAEMYAQNEKMEKPCWVAGICDDPENQSRRLFTYQPLLQGHLMICGGPATGKTVLLQLLLEQIVRYHTPWQVSYLLVSIEQEGLSSYIHAAHCMGSMIHQEEAEVFFYQLQQLVKKRKKELAGRNYRAVLQEKKGTVPLILLCIDGFLNLRKQLSEKQEEELLRIASEGIGNGIILVLTGNGTGDFPAKLFQKIKTTVCMEMSDPYQYGDVLRKYHGYLYPQSGIPGRGLCKVDGRILEFQTPVFTQKTEYWNTGKNPYVCFARIPREPEWSSMEHCFSMERNPDGIPLGYNCKTGALEVLSIHERNRILISGASKTGKTNLMNNIAASLGRRGKKTILIDFAKDHSLFLYEETICHITKEMELDAYLQSREAELSETMVLIPQLGLFANYVYAAGKENRWRREFWERDFWKQHKGMVIGCYQPQRDTSLLMTEVFKLLAENQTGIHLGGNAAAQRALEFEDLSFTRQSSREPLGIGYYKNGVGSTTVTIRIPLWREEKIEDDYRGAYHSDSE